MESEPDKDPDLLLPGLNSVSYTLILRYGGELATGCISLSSSMLLNDIVW